METQGAISGSVRLVWSRMKSRVVLLLLRMVWECVVRRRETAGGGGLWLLMIMVMTMTMYAYEWDGYTI